MNFPLISLIIVNFNGEKFIGRQYLTEAIQSFLETDYPNLELLLVDNASNDNSLMVFNEICKNTNINCKIVVNDSNLGFPGGCNKGFEMAKGEYVVLINNDDKAADPYWLIKLLDVIRTDSNIGACFSKKLKWYIPSEIDSDGLVIDRGGFVVLSEKKSAKQYIEERFAWQTPVIMRKKIIENIKYFFDDHYFIFHDDTEQSWRIRLAGLKIMYVPNSIVYHMRSATMKNINPSIVAFHGKKNIIYTLLLMYSLKNIYIYLPYHITISIVSAMFYCYKRQYGLANATIKAVLWNARNINKTFKKRYFIQHNIRKVSDDEITKHMKKVSLIRLWKQKNDSIQESNLSNNS